MSQTINKLKAAFKGLNLKDDKGLILSFTSVFAGLIFGAVITDFSKNSIKNEVLSLFVSYFTDFTDKSKTEIFCGILIEVIIYFCVLFISGSNIFGKELSLIFTAFKASGITSIVSVLYSEYALKGLEYSILVFMPGKVLLIFSMLFITKCSYVFSDALRKGFSNTSELKSAKNLFVLKSLTAFSLILLSCIIDFVNIIVFSGLFDFKQ